MKCDVAAEAVELGDDHRRAVEAGGVERGLQLRPALERIGTLAGLDLLEDVDQVEALDFAEAGDCLELRVETEIAAAVLGQADIGDCVFHGSAYNERFILLQVPLPIYFTVASRSAGPDATKAGRRAGKVATSDKVSKPR